MKDSFSGWCIRHICKEEKKRYLQHQKQVVIIIKRTYINLYNVDIVQIDNYAQRTIMKKGKKWGKCK